MNLLFKIGFILAESIVFIPETNMEYLDACIRYLQEIHDVYLF